MQWPHSTVTATLFQPITAAEEGGVTKQTDGKGPSGSL